MGGGTGRRNRHKMGSYLITDDISGFTEYRENVTKDWRGFIVNKNYVEERNPQEFIRVGTDPKALTDIRHPAVATAYVSAIASTIGTTNVVKGTDMIDHFYTTTSGAGG